MFTKLSATEFQSRTVRWLLLLTLIHTVPVLWITPVAAGTAPTVAFFFYGLALMRSVSLEGLAFIAFALVPGLFYLGLSWLLAWVLDRLLAKVSKQIRVLLLFATVMPLLLIVYQPVYMAGGHNGSTNTDLLGLFAEFGNTLDISILKYYWLALHVLLAGLFSLQCLPNSSRILDLGERWRGPTLVAITLLLASGVVARGYPALVCRPLAEIGFDRAQVCVAKVSGNEAGDWYERAAIQGNVEAITWMVSYVSSVAQRGYWIQRGAQQGDAALQFKYYQQLVRAGTSQAEASEWLHKAAVGDHEPALMAWADQLSNDARRKKSSANISEYQTFLERAADLGSRPAKMRLAQHYIDGGMGYTPDLNRARDYFHELANTTDLTKLEIQLQRNQQFYEKRAAEVEQWLQGIADNDPTVMKTIADAYLSSPLPADGVRQQGAELLEKIANAGDLEARDELMLGLRTGSGGIARDQNAAMSMLLEIAATGELVAMERVRGNYFNGQEGFPRDYSESRRWILALIEKYERRADKASGGRLRQLNQDLQYIERLDKQAGGKVVGVRQLEQLAGKTDADSHYQYALQLLAAHIGTSRGEAIDRLHKAAALGHADASWRLVSLYERGARQDLDSRKALKYLHLAVEHHHFEASKELAFRYEDGKKGIRQDLPKAIALYEATLAAVQDNRHGWNLNLNDYNSFAWVKSRLKQARQKYNVSTK